jgi:hypothetical protein
LETMKSSPPLATCQTGVGTAVPFLRYVVRLTYLLRPMSSMTVIVAAYRSALGAVGTRAVGILAPDAAKKAG